MQRNIQSAEAGKSTDEFEICYSDTESDHSNLPHDIRKYDGSRSDKEHNVRLCNVDVDFAVIEMECLRGRNNELIVKELAICSDNCLNVYNFRPPYEEVKWNREENRWIENNLNGFGWYDGDISYYKLITIVRKTGRMFKNIYTKGLEKYKLLEKILGPTNKLWNLDDFNVPKHRAINCAVARCLFHQHKFINGKDLVCSVVKSMKYVGWIKGQKQQQQQHTQEEEERNQQQQQYNE